MRRSILSNSPSSPRACIRLYMTDRHRAPDPVAIAQSLPRGSWIILREYDAKPASRRAQVSSLSRICRRRGLTLLAAGLSLGSWALASGRADGIHIPRFAATNHRSNFGGKLGRNRGARQLRRRGAALITTGAHTAADIRRAARAGVDAILISPVYPTHSHPGAAAIGPHRFYSLAKSASVPVFALGGMTEERFWRLKRVPGMHPGLIGYAGIGCFVSPGGKGLPME